MIQAFALIFVSEIGDKTFILVTIYAAKMKFCLLFLVASFGMCLMHTLSTLLGSVFTLFVPKLWTQIITVFLFWVMGLVAIYQGAKKLCCKKKRADGDESSSDEAAELAAAVAENEAENAIGQVAKSEPEAAAPDAEIDLKVNPGPEAEAAENDQADKAADGPEGQADIEAQEEKPKPKPKKKMCCKCKNPILFFLALLMCSEWGDRSQISAIALAPNYGLGSIVVGGCLAHMSCILCGMLLGKIVQKFCTETVINLLGGVLFIAFGLYEVFFQILYPDAISFD